MNRDRNKIIRYTVSFILLGIALLLFLGWNICAGSVSVSLSDILKSVAGQEIEATAESILWEIRMPRALTAAILGGALALSGYLLQTFFHNPIASPFVLGISSGAKLVVALVMVFAFGHAAKVSSVILISAAFVGAMISMGFCFADIKKSRADVHAGRQRRDDRLYLFGGDGSGRDLCGGCGYRESS